MVESRNKIKNEILSDIKQKIFDLKDLYPDCNIKLSFNVPASLQRPEKIKHEITEIS